MAKYECSSCGRASATREIGACPECGAQGSYRAASSPVVSGRKRSGGIASDGVVTLGSVSAAERARVATGIAEFDRVTGGGLVTGSLLLLAGEPGSGKTTLLSQVIDKLVAAGHSALYVSGEESAGQIRLRAERLGLDLDALEVLAETNAATVAATLAARRPAFAVIDSIQTLVSPDSDGAPGGPAQVREVTSMLMAVAKAVGSTLLIVGHVNKDAAVAGPKTLEHLVDGVFLLEGDPHGFFRVLRATKNRFGAIDEIGLFEMRESGMIGVDSPAPLDAADGFGRALVPVLEGTRPLLVEVQALVGPAAYGTGRRLAVGIADKRLAMLMAVLERYCHLGVAAHDIYVQVSGGLTVAETAIDAAVCAAVASSYLETALPPAAAVVGEVGLSGELRAVRGMPSRAKEAARAGVSAIHGPQRGERPAGIEYRAAATLPELLTGLGMELPDAPPKRAKGNVPGWVFRSGPKRGEREAQGEAA